MPADVAMAVTAELQFFWWSCIVGLDAAGSRPLAKLLSLYEGIEEVGLRKRGVRAARGERVNAAVRFATGKPEAEGLAGYANSKRSQMGAVLHHSDSRLRLHSPRAVETRGRRSFLASSTLQNSINRIVQTKSSFKRSFKPFSNSAFTTHLFGGTKRPKFGEDHCCRRVILVHSEPRPAGGAAK